jgi:uncharacterized protein (DUF2147 family)
MTRQTSRRTSAVLAGSIAAVLATGAAAATAAADPSGQWLVADGSAVMKIEQCGDGYYASIDWEKMPGVDSHNRDPAKRGRPLTGVSILVGMQSAGPNEWEGRVYNPKDGGMYDAHMKQTRPDAIRIEGCVLGGLICDGETWTRVQSATTGAASGRGRSYCPR